jgi:hypothetical protein
MSDANLERITILLQARDRDFARAMDRNNKLIARLNRDGSRNMTQMSRTVNSRMDEMAGRAASFGANFVRGLALGAVAAAVAGITASVRGAVSALSALGKAARDAGIDVEELQGLQRGFARAARVSEDDVTRALIDFNVRIGQAVEGQGEFARISERLGIALRRPNGEMRTQSELLAEVAARIRAAGSASERAAIAQGAFGEVGRRLADALSGGPEALRQMTDQARAAGDVIDRNLILRAEILDDKFDALTRRVGSFFRALAVNALAGGAETPADTLERMFGTLERARAILGDGVFDSLIGELQELATIDGVDSGLERVQRSVHELRVMAADAETDISILQTSLFLLGETDASTAVSALSRELQDLLGRLADGALGSDEFADSLSEVVARALAAADGLGDMSNVGFAGLIGRLRAVVSALTSVRQEAIAAAAALPGGSDPAGPGGLTRLTARLRAAATDPMGVGGLAPTTPVRPRAAPPLLGEPDLPPGGSGSRGTAGGGADGYAASIAQIQERTRALEIEAAALVAVAASGRDYGDAVEFARVKAELLTAAMAAGRQITPELEAQIDALAEAYVTAGQSAEQAAESIERIREASERGVDAMTDIFMAMGQGSDAAKQAVARLILEIARMQAMRGFSLLAQGSDGGGVFGWLGRLLSGPGGIAGARADGGPVAMGRTYLVGERGPELFTPGASGGIMPNHRMGGGAMQVTIGFDRSAGGFTAMVRDEAGRVVAQAAPALVRQSVGATYAASTERRFK